ncbi:hypothetical protein GDO81_011746 [Engystomops pustulosus]|uniref:Uncharacterized protein n=1 Tax=Engystomops pustulosus TaxID=76066 RepID=A0AAV7BGM1_ENGPU|nr:hypothetical protein GDO81_011746 [Engystomops pustulosus]
MIFGPMGALRMQLFSGLPERVNYFTLTSLTLQSQDVCLDLLDLLHHLLSSSMKYVMGVHLPVESIVAIL